MSNFDERAKEDFDKRTEQETYGLKDEIWNRFRKRIIQRRES